MLTIEGVRKKFGENEVIKGIDLHVDKGDVIAIIGRSGSGKTTLLRCISFLEKPDEGRLTLDFDSGKVNVDEQLSFSEKLDSASPTFTAESNAVDITRNRNDGSGLVSYDMSHVSGSDIRKIRSHMGFVFQNYNLFTNMTALENCMEGLVTARHMKKNDAKEIALKCLEKVGLSDRVNYYPGELSGGQQQRVAIARALAIEPDIMLFDEPTSALDPELTVEVLDTIRKLAKEGTTMLVVTHEMAFARDVANRAIFMENGAVVEEGPVPEIFDSPKMERTKEFLSL